MRSFEDRLFGRLGKLSPEEERDVATFYEGLMPKLRFQLDFDVSRFVSIREIDMAMLSVMQHVTRKHLLATDLKPRPMNGAVRDELNRQIGTWSISQEEEKRDDS